MLKMNMNEGMREEGDLGLDEIIAELEEECMKMTGCQKWKKVCNV
jgi:hypothetical protein